MPALAQSLGRPYAEVVARVRAAGRSLPDVERHTLGRAGDLDFELKSIEIY